MIKSSLTFSILGTSSIDTTCTIWGLETGQVIGRVNMVTGQVKTQLIAHDKEVYDIAFSKGKDYSQKKKKSMFIYIGEFILQTNHIFIIF